MKTLFNRNSNYSNHSFNGNNELTTMFHSAANILVVGAGGLGCEILKNLALSEVKNIFVVDLDTIEISNLNRQFLFRKSDIGKLKAEVASNFIKKKYPDIDIRWSNHKVQDLSKSFFKQFSCIIGGLDNMEARFHLNKMVHELVEFTTDGNVIEETVIPFIDGGTEGLRGQSRVIIPYKTSCLSCTKALDSKRVSNNLLFFRMFMLYVLLLNDQDFQSIALNTLVLLNGKSTLIDQLILIVLMTLNGFAMKQRKEVSNMEYLVLI